MISALDATGRSATGGPSRAASAADRTRDRITREVSEHGPITAAELAARLGLTAAAVRRHLDGLAQAALVTEHERVVGTRRRGRPARAYVLTEAGHGELGGDYRELASDVLTFVGENLGDEAIHAYARRRADQLAEHIDASVRDASRPLEQRAERLAVGLSREGYAASARPVGEGSALAGVQLCQGHCPVRDVAEQFPQLCEAETAAFSELLGVHVQRLATQAQGHHVCTTFIPRTAAAAAAGGADPRTQRSTERDPR